MCRDSVTILCHDEMFRKNWEETELKQLIDRLKTTGLYEFSHTLANILKIGRLPNKQPYYNHTGILRAVYSFNEDEWIPCKIV